MRNVLDRESGLGRRGESGRIQFKYESGFEALPGNRFCLGYTLTNAVNKGQTEVILEARIGSESHALVQGALGQVPYGGRV